MAEIHKKMIAILNDTEAITKGKTNAQQGYKYRGIDDMYNALQPLFKKHGVFVLSEVLAEKRDERQTQKGGTLFYVILDVKFSFCAEDGSAVYSTVKGEAMDSGDKATNKALSAALKYALMQTFLIPTEELKELNTENDTHEPAPKGKPSGSIADAYTHIDAVNDASEMIECRNWLNKFSWSNGDKTALRMKLDLRDAEINKKGAA